MRAVIVIAALAGTLWFAAAEPAPIADTITLDDGGSARVFEVACDELHCRPVEGVNHPALIPDQGDAATTAKTARAREGRGGTRFDLVLYERGKARSARSRRSLSRRILVTMDGSAAPAEIARATGAKHFENPDYSPRHLVLTFANAGDSLQQLDAVRASPGVMEAAPLLGQKKVKKLTPNDPRYAWSPSNLQYQWHLNNTGQNGSVAGLDANIESAWDQFLGTGVTISIVDDGLEVGHPDLAANVNTAIDHDWNDATPDDPTPFNVFDDHGTSCAGVAAARGNNSLGVTGAAPRATLVGLRLIAGDTTDADDAEALHWRTDVIDISSNSWGQGDNGDDFFTMGPLLTAALHDGATNGRGGRGTIYVWAGGNGRGQSDYSNYDGYNNAIETITVGAVDFTGHQASYSESGANLLICAPSDANDFQPAITTTTLSVRGAYTDNFGGTSSATPLVAGVIALMLEANPNLGWRDVQEILIRSAERIDAASTGWADNGAGFHFHHGYGAGMVDATAAVAMAQAWQDLGTQYSASASAGALNLAIPENPAAGIDIPLQLDGTDLRAEHVQLTVDIDHPYRGDVVINLISPDGTVSQFSETHADDGADISNYTFLSVRHWGEMCNGTWTVNVSDGVSGDSGSVQSLALRVFGTAAPTSFELWQLGQFDANQLADPEISGPAADPDRDERPNLFEYAVAGNPLRTDTIGEPELVEQAGTVRLRYVADGAKTDLSYVAMLSINLVNWTEVAEAVISTDGTLETREVVLPGGMDRQFARVEITR